jgi:ABC-type phosphate/phosphonate transport system substrate-binding protein
MMNSSYSAIETNDQKPIIMGGSAVGLRGASKQDTEATFNVYLNELFKQTDSRLVMNIVIYPDSESLLTAFDKGEIDGFFGTPLDYLSRKDQLCKTVVGVGYKNLDLKQNLLVIVRADEGITQLKELRNKRLTLSTYMDTETLFLNTSLLRNSLPEIPEFFSERKDAKNPNIALMDVFFNKTDVTVVRENEYKTAVELNPQLGKKLIILTKSEPYLATTGAIRNKISEDEFKAFVNAFQKVVNTEKGKKLMSFFSVSRVELVSSDELLNLQALMVENTMLKKSIRDISLKPSVVGKTKTAKIKNH